MAASPSASTRAPKPPGRSAVRGRSRGDGYGNGHAAALRWVQPQTTLTSRPHSFATLAAVAARGPPPQLVHREEPPKRLIPPSSSGLLIPFSSVSRSRRRRGEAVAAQRSAAPPLPSGRRWSWCPPPAPSYPLAVVRPHSPPTDLLFFSSILLFICSPSLVHPFLSRDSCRTDCSVQGGIRKRQAQGKEWISMVTLV